MQTCAVNSLQRRYKFFPNPQGTFQSLQTQALQGFRLFSEPLSCDTLWFEPPNFWPSSAVWWQKYQCSKTRQKFVASKQTSLRDWKVGALWRWLQQAAHDILILPYPSKLLYVKLDPSIFRHDCWCSREVETRQSTWEALYRQKTITLQRLMPLYSAICPFVIFPKVFVALWNYLPIFVSMLQIQDNLNEHSSLPPQKPKNAVEVPKSDAKSFGEKMSSLPSQSASFSHKLYKISTFSRQKMTCFWEKWSLMESQLKSLKSKSFWKFFRNSVPFRNSPDPHHTTDLRVIELAVRCHRDVPPKLGEFLIPHQRSHDPMSWGWVFRFFVFLNRDFTEPR